MVQKYTVINYYEISVLFYFVSIINTQKCYQQSIPKIRLPKYVNSALKREHTIYIYILAFVVNAKFFPPCLRKSEFYDSFGFFHLFVEFGHLQSY